MSPVRKLLTLLGCGVLASSVSLSAYGQIDIDQELVTSYSGHIVFLTGALNWQNFVFSTRKDLSLTDQQERALVRLSNLANDRKNAALEALPQPDTEEMVGEVFGNNVLWFASDLHTVLLPHQLRTLKETAYQWAAAEAGPDEVVQTLVKANEDDLTPEQMAELRKKIADMEKQLAEKIRQARQEVWAEFARDLSPELRAMFDQTLGIDRLQPDAPAQSSPATDK